MEKNLRVVESSHRNGRRALSFNEGKKCVRCGMPAEDGNKLCLDCIVELESKQKEMEMEM